MYERGAQENVLVTPNAQGARTQQGESPNQMYLPFCFPSMAPRIRLMSFGVLAEGIVE